MNSGLTLAGGVALGAGLMYILDPDMGQRRRALALDTLTRTRNVSGRTLAQSGQNLANRARGAAAEAQALLRRSESAPDGLIVSRVRSQLGHVVSHPHAVEVTANHGYITLSGPILANELTPLLARVSYVPGVRGVENRLQVYLRADSIPGLQRA